MRLDKKPSPKLPSSFAGFDIEIVDFSPEWDYTTGGTKLLICIKPSSQFENLPD